MDLEASLSHVFNIPPLTLRLTSKPEALLTWLGASRFLKKPTGGVDHSYPIWVVHICTTDVQAITPEAITPGPHSSPAA